MSTARGIARYKDLCLDVADVPAMTAFWASALGLSAERLDDGDTVLRGPTPRHTVWLNAVPEPHTVKNRVHLDVLGGSVEELERLGARVLPDQDPFDWTVLHDPDGGELCVFVRDEPPSYRGFGLVVDAAERGSIAGWWADVLGATVSEHPDHGTTSLDDVDGLPFDGLVFVDVPEPKTVKNRVHWDLDVDDAAAVEVLIDRGARMLQPRGEVPWDVLADPEGNEFCVFTPGSDG